MTLQPFFQCLQAGEEWQRISTQLQQLTALQQALQSALPQHLQPLCKVANLRQTKQGMTAVILTANGHTLAALRQLRERLHKAMTAHNPQITSLQFRIQPDLRDQPPP